METIFIGKNFVELKEIPSTNDWCDAQSGVPLPEGTVVWAHSQTAGKGQRGNTWLAAPGQNLTFSLILHPTFLQPGEVFYLNKLLSCALFEALTLFLPQSKIQIKWPNDLLVNGKKVCGMLLRNQFDSSRIKRSVIGIGLNVNQIEFPPEIRASATSLKLSSGLDFDLKSSLMTCLSFIEKEYMALRAGKRPSLDRRYLAQLYGYQEPTLVKIGGKLQTIIPVGVDSHGRLAVEQGGKLSYFGMKEIEFQLQ